MFIELVAYNGECYNFQYCLNGCCRVFHYCFLLPQGIILYNPRKLMKNSRLCYIFLKHLIIKDFFSPTCLAMLTIHIQGATIKQ